MAKVTIEQSERSKIEEEYNGIFNILLEIARKYNLYLRNGVIKYAKLDDPNWRRNNTTIEIVLCTDDPCDNIPELNLTHPHWSVIGEIVDSPVYVIMNRTPKTKLEIKTRKNYIESILPFANDVARQFDVDITLIF